MEQCGRGPFVLMTVDELVKAVSGVRLFSCGKGTGIRSVAVDSRNVTEGALFVPLRGANQDGHIFIEAALKNGAVCFFSDEKNIRTKKKYLDELCKNYAAACICVNNTLSALQAAAASYLNKFPKLLRIGITGSSGKTTVKEITASIFSNQFNTIASEGNLNSETGLPLSVFKVRDSHEVGVFELGMNRRGEIAELAGILKPDIALITNIGSAHIGLLGSNDAIAAEKKEIFSHFNEKCTGIIPDCGYTDFLKDIKTGNIVVYSEKNVKGVENITSMGLDGYKITYCGKDILYRLPGSFNLKNAFAAITIAYSAGLSADSIQKGLESVTPLYGRSQVVKGFATYFFDCYNANPESMVNAIEFCNSIKISSKKFYILASMLELGDESIAAHSAVCRAALNSDAGQVYLFGDEFCSAVQEKGICDNRLFCFGTDEIEILKRRLCEKICKDDFVFLKGSRGMALERLEEILNTGR